jgi:L-asparaginase
VKKVTVLYTGGTLAMRVGPSGALEPDAYGHDLLAELPVLGRIASIDARVIANLDSGDMQPSDWVTVAREVHAAVADPGSAGVLVVHGTDTMAYTASAVALMLGSLPKPVVFTGAQRPLAEARTDARGNLVDACLIATLPVPEVGIAFASRFHRAVRATKRDAWALDAFDSPNCPCLVDLGLGESIASHVRPSGALAPLDARLDERVLAIRVFPGLDPAALLRALTAGTRGIVLEGYGTGNLPHLAGSMIPVLEEAARLEVPVLVVSQCLRGTVDLPRYSGGAAAAQAGAISGRDMTVEAAIAKMMIALGRYSRFDDVRAFLGRDVVGELTLTSS